MNELATATGPSATLRDAQLLIVLVAVALGFATLLVGVAGPDDRLALQGIPLSSVLYFAAFVVAMTAPCLPSTHSTVLIFLVPVGLLGLTLPLSHDQQAGAIKLFNLIATAFAASILLASAVQRVGTETVLRLLVGCIGLLLGAALAYKVRYGFFDRQVLFLMNGPIVFGRVMGLGCLCSLAAFRGLPRLLLSVMFFLAVVWTASKGPILALLIASATYVLLLGSRTQRTIFAGVLATAVIGVIVNYDLISDWQPLSRVFEGLQVMSTGVGFDIESIGSRWLLIQESIEVLLHRPFGVGVGGWSAATGIRWASYPHNFLLELWTEGGLLLGTVAALPYLVFLLRRVDVWWVLCLFFLLCQQVSGDLLDSRYWLTFCIVGFLCRSEGLRIPDAPRLHGYGIGRHEYQRKPA